MDNYDEIAKTIKSGSKGNPRISIFEPHFQLIVELLKRGVRRNQILEHIKTIDPKIAEKNERTAQSLFSQFSNTQRVQNLISTNVYITTKKTVALANANKRGRGENLSLQEDSLKKEEIAPIAEQKGESVAKTTKEILPLNSEEEKSLEAIRIRASKDPKSISDEERKILSKHLYEKRK